MIDIHTKIDKFLTNNENWAVSIVLPYDKRGDNSRAAATTRLLGGIIQPILDWFPKDKKDADLLFDYTKCGIWSSAADILPLEGVYAGYSPFDTYMLSFFDDNEFTVWETNIDAAILNLPEFIYEIAHSSLPNAALDKAYFYFLNSLPFNPPYLPSTAKPYTANESSPSMLFKTSAGVYSVPKYYMHWLGGIWNYYGKDLQAKSFIDVQKSSVNDGFIDVYCEADRNKKNTDFFLFGDYATYTESFQSNNPRHILVNFDKILNDSIGTQKLVKFGTGSGILVDQLAGFGNYPDIIYPIYNEIYLNQVPFYGDTPLAMDDISLYEANFISKLHTFKTYGYVVNDYFKPNMYGTYSALNYIEPLATPTTFETTFKLYSYLWKYFYHSTSFDSAHQQLFDLHKSGTSKIEIDKINELMDLFKSYSDSNGVISKDLNPELQTKYPKIFTTSADRGYIGGNDDTRELLVYVLDFIGALAYRFKDIAPLTTLTDQDIEKYYIQDPSYVFCLYPSGGGFNTLAYSLQNMDFLLSYAWITGGLHYGGDHIRNHIVMDSDVNKIRVNTNESESDSVAEAFINIMTTSCHWLWYTGPYAGVYDSTQVLAPHPSDNLSLSKANEYFLSHKDEFSQKEGVRIPKESRCYTLSPDHRFNKMEADAVNDEEKTLWFTGNQPIFRVQEILDYIGTRALDNYRYEFNTGVANFKSILYALLIVDKQDFTTVNVDGIVYEVDVQLDLLLLYDNILSKKYEDGTILKNDKNILKVLNAALTNAQTHKAQRVVNTLLKERELVNVGSVFEYTHSNGVYNMFHSALASNVARLSGDGAYIKNALFGNQSNVTPYINGSSMAQIYKKYINIPVFEHILLQAVNYFFQSINVQPNEDTVKIAKDFITMFCRYRDLSVPEVLTNTVGYLTPSLKYVADRIDSWQGTATKDVQECVRLLETNLEKINAKVVDVEVQKRIAAGNSDLNKLKQRTYYNIKSIYDNWLSIVHTKSSDDGLPEIDILYNHNTIPCPNMPTKEINLVDQFLFLDRANRNIGQNMLINIDWLSNYLTDNLGYGNNTNISIYSFLSNLAQQHASVLHSLPAFINFGRPGDFSINPDQVNFIGQLFDTYTYVDVIDSEPKFIFQFIGNTNTILNLPQNKNLRSQSKGYLISDVNSYYDQKTNSIVNIKNSVNGLPDDMKDANCVSFIVNFGTQEQQMFSNLQLDQSEFQNTEEFYQSMTNVANNQTKTQSADLFTIFTQRSYSATVDTLGNLMIQPLMFFDLVNVPMFYGNYWITNVKHSITPNDIKTTFKGVRQPYSTIPKSSEVLMQLAEMEITNLLGTNATGGASGSGSSGGGSSSGGGGSSSGGGGSAALPLSTTKGLKDFQLSNQKAVKDYLKTAGLSTVAIAGIMGNMHEESKFNPTAGWTDVNGFRSHGLIQWNAKSYNLTEVGNTIESQLKFLTTKTFGYAKYVKEIIAQESKGEIYAAYLFASLVEICSYCNKGYDTYEKGGSVVNTSGKKITIDPFRRSLYARDFWQRFNNQSDSLYGI